MNLGIVTRLAGRAGLVLSKHAPTILTAAGTVGFIGTTVLASKATLKVEETLAEETALLVKVHEAHEDGKLTDKDATRDKVILYTRMTTKLAKLYAPALILGAASIASLITGHGIWLQLMRLSTRPSRPTRRRSSPSSVRTRCSMLLCLLPRRISPRMR